MQFRSNDVPPRHFRAPLSCRFTGLRLQALPRFAPLAFAALLAAIGCGEESTPQPEPDTGFQLDIVQGDETTGGSDVADTGPGGDDDTPEVEEDVYVVPPGSSDGPWPMLGRNPGHAARTSYVGALNPVERWNLKTSGVVTGSAVIGHSGVAYVGSADGNLYAMDLETGAERWFRSTGGPIEGAPAVGIDEAIYVGSRDGLLWAFGPNGGVRWTAQAGGPIVASMTMSASGPVVGARDGLVYAVDYDGTTRWSYETGGPVVGAAAIGTDDTIYVGSEDDKLHAIGSDGTAKWAFKTEGDIRAAPSIADDGTIYVASVFGLKGDVFAVTPEGAEKWFYKSDGGVENAVSIGPDGTLYLGSIGGSIVALNPDDGSVKWTTVTSASVQASPTIGGDGTIYAGSFDTKLYALNPKGEEIWSESMGGLIRGGIALADDGTLLVPSDTTLRAIGGGAPCEGTPPDCSDDDPCTVDRCDPEAGCVHEFLCDDGNECTTDGCNDQGGCVYTNVDDGTACDDGFDCTSGGACGTGECISTTNACGPAQSAWPLRGRDLKNTARTDFPAAQLGGVKWSYNIGRPISASPVLGKDGTLYVGVSSKPSDDTKGALVAIDKSGALKWEVTFEDQVSVSPAVNDYGTVFIGCRDSNLYAFGPDGTEKWRYKAGWIRSSPTISNEGLIIFGTEEGLLHAVAPDGKAVWTWDSGAKIASSPAIGDDGAIYFGTSQGKVIALESDGTLRWEVQTGFKIDLSSPVIGDNGHIYIGAFDGKLYAITAQGQVAWTLNTGGPVDSTPALGPDGAVYIGSQDKRVYAVNQTGDPLWDFETSGTVNGTLTAGSDGTVYVGVVQDVVAGVYAIRNGDDIWSQQIPGGVFSGLAVDYDGTVYVAALDGIVYALGGGGPCEGEDAPTCIADDNCTTATCDPEVGCIIVDLCDDGNPCTDDFCGAGGTCVSVAAGFGTPCDDGLACTTGESCVSGACLPDEAACPASADGWSTHGNSPQGGFTTDLNGPQTDLVSWTFNSGSSFDGGGVAVRGDGTALVGALNGILYALRKKSPSPVVWTFDSGGAIRTTPTITEDGRIYFANDAGNLYALYDNGQEIWSYTTPTSAIRSSPTVGGDGHIYVGSNDNKVYSVAADGDERWVYSTGGQVRGTIALSSDSATAYAASLDNNLHAINTADGSEKWVKPLSAPAQASPVVGSDGTIYIATLGSTMVAVNPAGEQAWIASTGCPIKYDVALYNDTLYMPVEPCITGGGGQAGGVMAAMPISEKTITASLGATFTGAPAFGANGIGYAGADDGAFRALNTDLSSPWGLLVASGAKITSPVAIGPGGFLYIPSFNGILTVVGP